MPNFDFQFDPNNMEGSLAELMRYMKWFNNHLDDVNLKYFAWGDSIVDNVDATHKLKLKFYIPDGVLKVQKLRLNFSVEAFRAYETGAASGGGSSTTSASGGGSTETSSSEGYHDHQVQSSGVTANTNSAGEHEHNTIVTPEGDHTHGGAVASDGTHSHVVVVDTELGHSHSFTQYIADYTVAGGTHTHTINVPSHSHSVTVPSHTHDITYGIYESTSAAGCKVYVDGTLRLDNGGAGYSTDQANLDLTQWVATAGWHTIEISSTQLGRINAAYFVQVYVGASGI